MLTNLTYFAHQLDYWEGLLRAGAISQADFFAIANQLAADLPDEIRDDVKRELLLRQVQAGWTLDVREATVGREAAA